MAGFYRIFKVAFLLFLAPAGDLTCGANFLSLRGTQPNLSSVYVKLRRNDSSLDPKNLFLVIDILGGEEGRGSCDFRLKLSPSLITLLRKHWVF